MKSSDTLEYPTLENLWSYLSRFYDQLDETERDQFIFEDLAGIYQKNGRSQLFATCLQYPEQSDLTVLPAGIYLCADCTGQNKEQVLKRVLEIAREDYGTEPPFCSRIDCDLWHPALELSDPGFGERGLMLCYWNRCFLAG